MAVLNFLVILQSFGSRSRCNNDGINICGTDESPGKKFKSGGKIFKQYRGMGSIGAMSAGSANRYFQSNFKDKSKFVPEGVEGREYKGKVSKIFINYRVD